MQHSPGEGEAGSADLLRIELLGGFRVAAGCRVIANDRWRRRKPAALVKLLALAPGHRLHREYLLDLLWPELDPLAAANNLRYALHIARRIIAPPPAPPNRYLQGDGDLIALAPDAPIWVDVAAFEAGIAAARRSRGVAAYQSALALYAGDLLPEDRFDDWATDRREPLRTLYLEGLLELAAVCEQDNEPAAAIETLQRLVEADPVHEEGHAALMRLYARTGQRQRALRQYVQLTDALRRELETEPEPATRRLHDQIRAGQMDGVGPAPGGPPAVRRGPDSNLPAPLSSFVGREQEIANVGGLLSSARLLTLTGVGGCGKTRLALRVAGDLLPRHTGGARLVELGALADPALVPHAVGTAIGVRETAGQPIVESLSNALRGRRLLLVLDNCEHLLGICAELVNALLRACPGLTVLATSRERLGLHGEVVWRVPTMSTEDSVRLFTERAAAVAPGFALTEGNTAAVTEICRRLDGIPLALELAAARVAALSVEQIAARLDGRFRLLTGGDPTALPRQQTLQATLDWSHALLTEPERVLLRRLSVFAGGAELAAAEAVCGAMGNGQSAMGAVSIADVLDILSRLVGKSLVVADITEEAPRFRLLETVRRYAEDRLIEAGEAAIIRGRHCTWFLGLAGEGEAAISGGSGVRLWLDRLDREHDNLRAALTWSIEQGETQTGLQLAALLWRFWEMRGHFSEGRAWLTRLLTLTEGKEGEPRVRRKALSAAGTLAGRQGDYAAARAAYAEQLGLARTAGDPKGVAAALNNLGIIARGEGDAEAARAYLSEALTIRRELGDRPGIASALNNLGNALSLRHEYEAARACYEESLAIKRELGDLGGVVSSLANLGAISLRQGDPDRAAALYSESLTLQYDLGDRRTTAECLEGFARIAVAQGRCRRATLLLGAAEALRQTLATPSPPAEHAARDQIVATLRAGLGEDTFVALRQAGQTLSLEQAIAHALADDGCDLPPD